MTKFRKSKLAKAVSVFVGIMTAGMMLAPTASAQTVSELTAQINSLLATIASLQSQLATISGGSTTTTGGACSYTFASNLSMGSTGTDVMNLQKVLNMSADTQVAASGTGSPGNESSYFGALTKAAVVKFQNKHAADVLAPVGLTAGTGFVGASTRAKLNMICSSSAPVTPTPSPSPSPTTPATAGLTVSLASDSPVASTLIAGQAVGTLAKFSIWNGNSAPVKVTGVKLQRSGVSADTTLSNVYLFEGSRRVTDAASVSTGIMNFVDSSGIVTIPAMSSVVLVVRADIAASTNGQTVGVVLTELTSDSAGATTGLPVSSSQHNIASAPTGMTTADFSTTALPAAASIDPQNDYPVWQRTLTIGGREADLKSLRFRQIGSVLSGDLANFRLQIDGTQVGNAVAALDSQGYVTFDLSAAPKRLLTGGRTVKVIADIVGGSNRNFTFSLRQAGDIELADSQLGVTVLPTAGSSAFSAQDSGQQSINQGVLTITKATDSLSGNVTLNGSGLTLGKFKFKAQGEKLKVESLRISHTASDAVWTGIRNGALFLDGAQVGSTATINEDSQSTAYTQFNLGSSMVLDIGKEYTLEVRGDVYNTNTTANTSLISGTTTVVNIAAGSSNVQRLTSLNYFSNTAVSANTLTVATGAATLSKYSAYANQTVTVPKTAYKVGEYRLQGGTSEAVNLNTITVGFNFDEATNIGFFTDVYVTYGSKTSSVKGTVATSTNTWSISETLAAGQVLDVKVYANLSSSLAANVIASTTMSFDGTGISSGSTVTTGTITGQEITVGTGSITAAADASTPIAAILVANSQPKVASFKFTTSNDSFTITELYASTTSNGSDVIGSLIWKDGATTIGTAPFSGAYATTTGLSLSIPANTTKTIDAYLQLGDVNTPGAATSSRNVQLGLDGYRNVNSSGVASTTSGSGFDVVGNKQFVYKTKPTISNVALPSTTLTAGTKTLAKFTVSADASGAIEWKRLRVTISKTAAVTLATTTWAIYDSANEGVALTTSSTSQSGNLDSNGTSGGFLFELTTPEGVGAGQSKTYVIKATVGGTIASGNFVSTNITQGATAAAVAGYTEINNGASSFVWSDLSVNPHNATTAGDWLMDYLVRNLPTDSQTLTGA